MQFTNVSSLFAALFAFNVLVTGSPIGDIEQVINKRCLAEGDNCDPGAGQCCSGLSCEFSIITDIEADFCIPSNTN